LLWCGRGNELLRGQRWRERSRSHKLLQIHLILWEVTLLFCQFFVDLNKKTKKKEINIWKNRSQNTKCRQLKC
jgi:hypothetical protein